MKSYSIAMVWQMYGKMIVNADSLEEAKELAMAPPFGLPKDGSYIEDSAEIDDEGCSELFGEKGGLRKKSE